MGALFSLQPVVEPPHQRVPVIGSGTTVALDPEQHCFLWIWLLPRPLPPCDHVRTTAAHAGDVDSAEAPVVAVRPRVHLVVISARRGLFYARAESLRSYRGRTAWLQRRTGRGWRPVKLVRLGSRSAVRFSASLPSRPLACPRRGRADPRLHARNQPRRADSALTLPTGATFNCESCRYARLMKDAFQGFTAVWRGPSGERPGLAIAARSRADAGTAMVTFAAPRESSGAASRERLSQACLHASSETPGASPPGAAGNDLHALAESDRHEVRVAAPARNDVQVHVVDDAGAGDAAEVPAEVVARRGGRPRASALDARAPRAGGSRRLVVVGASPKSPTCRTGATSRCPDAYGNLFRSAKRPRARDATTSPSSSAPSTASQKMQPVLCIGVPDVLEPPRVPRAASSPGREADYS